MTTTLRAVGTLTAADESSRTLRGVLLPYGVPGRTNLGRVTAARGALRFTDPLRGNLGHDRDRPVAVGTVVEADDGARVEWTVPRTPAGDALLAEAATGLRTGMSVEVEAPVIRDGRLIGGSVEWAGFVVEPAFPTALLTAADAGDLDEPDERAADEPDGTDPAGTPDEDPPAADGEDDVDEDEVDEDEDDVDEDEVDEDDEDTPDEDGAPPVTATDTPPARSAGAPPGLRAAARADRRRMLAGRLREPADLYAMLADANRDGGDRRMLAALADVTATGLLDRAQPQWLGELWTGTPYVQRIVPLINGDTLTGLRLASWRWVTRPEVAPWAGDKAPVPSGPVDTEPVERTAERLAGAHDIDRAFRDFGDASFFAAYYSAMTESYARQDDERTLVELVDEATAVTAGAVPDGVPAEWGGLVDAALAIVDVGAPSFAIVAKDVWRSLVLTPRDRAVEFLSASLGLTEGTLSGFRIVPDASTLTAGQVLVGARQAATHYTLPGVPIRAEALDMVRGGVNAGVFGYRATVVHDPRALALVDLTPAP